MEIVKIIGRRRIRTITTISNYEDDRQRPEKTIGKEFVIS